MTSLLSEFKEGLGISLEALRANKMRSALTTLGIVIGIVTVTLMGTAIDGLNRAFLQSISVIGADVLYVERSSWSHSSHEEWRRQQARRPITLPQVKAVMRQMTQARAVAPFVATRRSVKYQNRSSSSVIVIGTSDQFQFTGGSSVAEGRFFSGAESDGGRPVCLLGFQVATNLFVHESPVGKRIRIDQFTFDVVGVLEKQGNLLGMFSLDNQVIVPVQQFVSQFESFPEFSIQVKVLSMERMADAREELRGVVRKIRHVAPGDEDDFAINQQEALLTSFRRVSGVIASAGLFITGLSLFVGGIGIMNIMFVSVAERTREIGIRKAVGAKRRAILLQFLTEATVICGFSGLLGLAIAFPMTFALKKFLPAHMSLTVVAIAVLVALFTGVVSGFFPAWRAARMNPVDALRNE
ncbi:MAG: ABC transporter permease [Verrucomicrobiia bacterium]